MDKIGCLGIKFVAKGYIGKIIFIFPFCVDLLYVSQCNNLPPIKKKEVLDSCKNTKQIRYFLGIKMVAMV